MRQVVAVAEERGVVAIEVLLVYSTGAVGVWHVDAHVAETCRV